ncbi:DUF1667 domain-containing protein [Clostridium minihomine]|uniref:DUF1667 domain-containing protein n=1 Tax=Clostridium minihomine TaxID=2045012 RepID=UPI000C75BA78|nr:DUF1667 domain-containing protein [Clostridium minihomine]
MTELTCIVCPRGCRLRVDTENGFHVTGNACSRGPVYAKQELTAPMRIITSTVRLKNSSLRRCPVKTSGGIPKGMMFDVMREINKATLTAPVHMGQTVLENVCGTGVDVVATRDILSQTE